MDFYTNLIVSDSDKIIEEENELNAELSMLLFDKLSNCNFYLFACRDRKEPALDEGEDSAGEAVQLNSYLIFVTKATRILV